MSGDADNEVEETEQEKALAEIAVKTQHRVNTVYRPLENRYFKRVDELNSPEAQKEVRGVAMQATASAAKGLQDATDVQRMSKGVSASSGRAKLGLADAAVTAAANTGETVGRAGTSQQDRYVAGLSNIVNMGQGKETQAIAGMGDVASTAQQNSFEDAANAWNDKQATANLVGTVAGLGLGSAMKSGTPAPGVSATPRSIESYDSTDINGLQSPQQRYV